MAFKETTKEFSSNQWNFGSSKDVSMEYLWVWSKQEILYMEVD